MFNFSFSIKQNKELAVSVFINHEKIKNNEVLNKILIYRFNLIYIYFNHASDDDDITTMSNITTTAVGDPELSTLVAALTRAGLVDTI
ncbi:MAG: hypothetical protein R2728_09885 [Chitinophagales bacterium]